MPSARARIDPLSLLRIAAFDQNAGVLDYGRCPLLAARRWVRPLVEVIRYLPQRKIPRLAGLLDERCSNVIFSSPIGQRVESETSGDVIAGQGTRRSCLEANAVEEVAPDTRVNFA
jgi:hypothetical protein